MAKPIEPTPILEGEDKRKFLESIQNISHDSKKEAFLKECDSAFEKVKKDTDL